MKTFRTTKGPFRERPWYEPRDVERICREELGAAELYPASPEPIRIERFIERRFGVSPAYEELSEGVLGFTRFGPRGVEAIVVSRALSENGSRSAHRRLNSTFAHEAGHGLLHAHLFALGLDARSLFENDSDVEPTRVLCRDNAAADGAESGQSRYRGRWWEFQANLAMGSLLMPEKLLAACLDQFLAPAGALGQSVLVSARREEATAMLSDTFDVSRVVAGIRLEQTFPTSVEAQLTL